MGRSDEKGSCGEKEFCDDEKRTRWLEKFFVRFDIGSLVVGDSLDYDLVALPAGVLLLLLQTHREDGNFVYVLGYVYSKKCARLYMMTCVRVHFLTAAIHTSQLDHSVAICSIPFHGPDILPHHLNALAKHLLRVS